MQTHSYSYADARQTFFSLSKNATIDSRTHAIQGPDGEIAMDIACWGDANAPRALVISSGTHGVEGYCGSFIQCELLVQGIVERMPADMMLMMVHGVNPYGFAWQRRVNEDNIDMNRNFYDMAAPPGQNEAYREIAEILEPDHWGQGSIEGIFDALAKVREKHGNSQRWQQSAMTGGQYEYPNGLFYGGVKPAWSNQQLCDVASIKLQGKSIAWVDVHTGLGQFGAAKCIIEYENDNRNYSRAKKLWGDRVQSTRDADSISAYVSGSIETGMERCLGDKLVSCGLEFGTRPGLLVIEALIADQWLHRYGDLNSEQGKLIKAKILDAFYPDEQKWRDTVLDIANNIVEAAINE